MMAEPLYFTEYEEEVQFDLDDPDFANLASGGTSTVYGSPAPRERVRSRSGPYPSRLATTSMRGVPMTLPGVHPFDLRTRERSHIGRNNRSKSRESLQQNLSLEDLQNYFNSTESLLTIEGLKNQLNSCFTCGVSWQEDHVSLDCSECGGYSLERPCPVCDGQCRSVWKRDMALSHSLGKAQWQGVCTQETNPIYLQSLVGSSETVLSERVKALKTSS